MSKGKPAAKSRKPLKRAAQKLKTVYSTGPEQGAEAVAEITPQQDAALAAAQAAADSKARINTHEGPKPIPVREGQAFGLVEIPVEGTSLTLLGLPPGADPKMLTLEQRIDIARRLNEVGPSLPKYRPKGKSFLSGMKWDSSTAAKEPLNQGVTMRTEEQEQSESAEQADPQAAPKKSKRKSSGEKASHPADHDPKTEKAMEDARQSFEKARAAKKKSGVARSADEVKKAAKAATKAAKTKPAAKSEKPASNGKGRGSAGGGKGKGIGAFCSDLLLKNKTTEQILAAVKEKYPDAKTSPASIAWYRNKLREEGKLKD